MTQLNGIPVMRNVESYKEKTGRIQENDEENLG
jgi:hypothetical protein